MFFVLFFQNELLSQIEGLKTLHEQEIIDLKNALVNQHMTKFQVSDNILDITSFLYCEETAFFTRQEH